MQGKVHRCLLPQIVTGQEISQFMKLVRHNEFCKGTSDQIGRINAERFFRVDADVTDVQQRLVDIQQNAKRPDGTGYMDGFFFTCK